jgi:hypothetical protein
MKKNYPVGHKISLTIVNERGKRVQCVSTVIGIGEKGGPYVKVDAPHFRNPPELELIEELIEEAPGGSRYRGEIGGAVLVPDFLWVAP